MKYLIVGANGALAQYFLKDERFSDNVALTHEELDITDDEMIADAIEKHKPNVVINCAALSNIHACEENPGSAMLVNCLGPTLIAKATKDKGIKLVHFSTASVFNGKGDGLFSEKDIPRAEYAYASTKGMGEAGIMLEGDKKDLIVRISWVFGVTSKSFVSRIPKLVKSNTELYVNNEQIAKATYAKDVVDATFKMIETDKKGVWHFTNSGETTRYEITEFVRKEFGIDELEVYPVKCDYFVEKIKQPKRNALDITRYEERFGKVRSWQDAYKEYLEELKTTQ